MKVAILAPGWIPNWTPELGWGGIEKVAWYHAKCLREMGVDAHFINVHPNDIKPVLDKLHPDIVHYHIENFFLPIKYYTPYAKTVFTSHAAWVNGITSEMEKAVGNEITRVARAVDYFVSLNYQFEKTVNRQDGKSTTIPNGADKDLFTHDFSKKKLNTFVCIGKHEERKKFSEVCKVFNNFRETRLVIIGPEGPDTPNIKKNLTPNIVLAGNLGEQDIAEALKIAEVGIHVSNLEMDCLVAREMLSAGCMLIGSIIVANNIREGGNVIKVNSRQDIYDAITNIDHHRTKTIKIYKWN